MSRFINQQSAMGALISSDQCATADAGGTWRDYIEITKPGINRSNLFATFTGYWLAAGLENFNIVQLILTLMGASLVIAGSCTLNNYIDRDIDPLMERTRTRAVPQGKILPSMALKYGVFLSMVGMLVLFFGVNPLSAVLAFIGFGVYVVIYTMWLKRVSTWNTVVGSVSGAMPPVIGWVAVTNQLDLSALVLFLILFMWQPPHFFALAMVKVEDYRAANIPMLPVVKNFFETKIQILIFTLLLVITSFSFVLIRDVSWLYLFVIAVLGCTYLMLSVMGFWAKDDLKWARQMFFYSLVYLPVLLISLIIEVMM